MTRYWSAPRKPVTTWKDNYPYQERMTPRYYEITKRPYRSNCSKLQGWVKETGQQVVAIIFEGRDAAGNGGTIKRFTEHLKPSRCTGWWRWRNRPGGGSWAVVLPAVRGATARGRGDRAVRPVLDHPGCRREGHGLLPTRNTPSSFGRPGIRADADPERDAHQIVVLRLPVEQRTRFMIRQIDSVRRWKLSPTDHAPAERGRRRWNPPLCAGPALHAPLRLLRRGCRR